jgi:hypothetical protein
VTPTSLDSAIIELLPANGSSERGRIPGIIHAFAHQWLTLITKERLATSTAVGIEHNDVLFMGDVVRSLPWGSDDWAVDIKVAKTLTGLESLMSLRAQLQQYQPISNDAPVKALKAAMCKSS